MSRAVSPVVGVVVLVGLTVLFGAGLLGLTEVGLSDPVPTVSLSLTVDGDENSIVLSHRGGDTLDVSELDVRVAVESEELRYQPPVPFFAADGFKSGPEGPFNSRSPNTFHAGERASVTLAETNNPAIEAGTVVSVRLSVDNAVLFEETATAT